MIGKFKIVKKNYLIPLFVSALLTTQLINIDKKTIASEVVDSSETKQILAQNMMGELTEEQVLAIMKEIEEAELNEDVDKIVSFLAPFVVSNVTVESQKTTITRHLKGKQAHRDFLADNFRIVQERENINSYMKIETSPGNEIITVSRFRLREMETDVNKEFLSSSTDIIHFALIENQPMIINIEVKGWIEERP